ncbi:MAG: DUF1385 domain-containing protein [Firmicutes bacterium]|nr:DUF1385 domain-containing protein [Bacillota bacterium]MDH7494353.1 DUF1385 domain-containing protein [Bacillota bacterium]
MSEEFFYGGQAVIEGVMMRGRRCIAIAVRRPDHSVAIHSQPIGTLATKHPTLRLAFVRGVVAFVETLVIGIRALMFSADQAVGEAEGEKLKPWELTLTLLMSLAVFIALFIVLPNLVAVLLQRWMRSTVAVNLAEGVFRLLVFLGYIVAVSRLQDIQRVFQYHGAEHKVIHSFEAGEDLAVENAKRHSTLHPRCGTAFLLIVMVIMVLVFSLLGRTSLLVRIATRLALLPLVTGVSYEVVRLAGRRRPPRIVELAIAPGLWLQRLTTREPDDAQLEVAIAALKGVLEADGG